MSKVDLDRWVGDEGPWDMARCGLSFASIALLIFGSFFGLVSDQVFGPSYGIACGLGFGLWYGLCFGLTSGIFEFIGYYGDRALLVRAGAAPWRYKAFLKAMTDRLLIRSGGDDTYLFTHQLLRDHFADRKPSKAATDATAGQ